MATTFGMGTAEDFTALTEAVVSIFGERGPISSLVRRKNALASSPELTQLHEKIRDQTLEFIDTVTNSEATDQLKTVELLSIIAGQIVEARFLLEEIKNNTE